MYDGSYMMLEDDSLALAILSLAHPSHHASLWRFILRARERYPNDRRIAPWRRPRRNDPVRLLAVLRLTADDYTVGPSPLPTGVVYESGTERWASALDDSRASAELLAGRLFTHKHRGWWLLWTDGARRDLHILLRHYAATWVEMGYRLHPIAAGSTLKAIRVTRGHHAWWLCDGATVCGHYVGSWDEAQHARLTVYRALKTELRQTIASTGLRASSRHLPEDLWLWRPRPALLSLARAGHGMRGGYVLAERYRGPAYKYDVRRLYTWCLTQPLPVRWALSQAPRNEPVPLGIWMCTVRGPGTYPIYLAPWDHKLRTYEPRLWRGRSCVAVLASPEIEPIRALGYLVEPAWGFRATQTMTLTSYVDSLQELLDEHGSESPLGQTAKLLGNSVWGKWAERPERDAIVYSADRLGPGWFPGIDERGEEIANVWTKGALSYSGHQQAPLAAMVTAYARARLYLALSTAEAEGCRVVLADTDSVVTDRPIPGLVGDSTDTIGQWRLVGADPDAIILGRKRYAFGDEAHIAGSPYASRRVLEVLYRDGVYEVGGRRVLSPWKSARESEAYALTLQA